MVAELRTVNVAVALVVPLTVTEAGVIAQRSPIEGGTLQVRAIGPIRSAFGISVTVALTAFPGAVDPEVGAFVMLKSGPSPESVTVAELTAALSVIVRTPVRGPSTEGVKITFT